MKLEISQPEGTPHEVELPGGEVVIGRDPSCDLVLNDDRCSRRHAIIEQTLEGLLVRDAGSANGVHVNGRRVERSRLRPGDTVRLGATVLTVIDQVSETVVIPPDGFEFDPATDDAPPLPPALSPPRTPSRSTSARRRPPSVPPATPPAPWETGPPLTVTALAVLWGLSAPASLAVGVILAARADLVPTGTLAVGTALFVASIGVLMALGLRARAGWARHLQIAAAGLGLLVCPFTFASATVLLYMLRPDVRATFEGGGAGAGTAEPTFALSLLGMLALGLALTAAAVSLLSGP